jgi:type VI protein secretion system component VasF
MNERLSEKEARFLEKARRSLLATEDRLDADTLSRLRDARVRAVEASGARKRGFFRIPNWARAGAFATVVAAVMVFMIWVDNPKQDLSVKSLDEFEMVLYADNMDIYEDMDFYEWLAGEGNGSSSS